MTSNVGSKAIAELSGKDEEEMRHQVDAAMAQTFRRVPQPYRRYRGVPSARYGADREDRRHPARRRPRTSRQGAHDACHHPGGQADACRGRLVPVFGARPLKRLVQREVVDAIAAAIIDGTVREGDQVTVDVDKDGGFTVVCDNTPAATYEVPDADRFWAMP